MSVGKRIKYLREKKNISQVELAKKCNLFKQTLHKYENDMITNIPICKIELIAKHLDVSPTYLMGWSDDCGEIHADEFAEILQDKRILEMIKKFSELNTEHQKTIMDNIDYLTFVMTKK